MARAIQLARLGLYSTSPNPRVGCVLVKDGRVIGEGWHKKAGEPHAEINALASADTYVKGATAYVTLEPCSHHGKTPPCATALVEAGVSRVVYGVQDPNPMVAGEGIKILENAGIAVSGPILEAEAIALNVGFFQRMKTGRPWIFAKAASSLDGRTAMQSGESKWITGEAARNDVQKWRARSCAIMTGVGTVLHDNPALTVRDPLLADEEGNIRQPLRVIVDSNLQIPLDAKIFDAPGNCLIAYVDSDANKVSALKQQGVELIQLATSSGKVDLQALLLELGNRNCNEVMVEAGASILGALLQEQQLDELVLYMASTLMGSDARPLAEMAFEQMYQQLRFDIKDIRKVGDDIRWQLTPQYLQP